MTSNAEPPLSGTDPPEMDSSDLGKRLPVFFGGLDEAVAPVQAQLDGERRLLEEQAAKLPDRLRSFFAGLAPAIDVARSAQAELDRRLATQFSTFGDFFHFIHKKENTLSRIFRSLLDPRGNHGQGRRFLDALLDEVRTSRRFGRAASSLDPAVPGVRPGTPPPPARDECRIHTEYSFVKKFKNKGRRGSIDIVIEWPRSKYWIGIENKPWAGEQEEQIREYFDALLDKMPPGASMAADSVLILYLSGTGADPTTAPADPVKRARCITMQYLATSDGPSVEGWLRRCRATCEAERIRWFLAELEDYIQRDPHFRSESELTQNEEESNDDEHPD